MKFLGWTHSQLFKQDLSKILPKPINLFHAEMIEPQNQTGYLISRKNASNFYAVDKKGYLIPIKFSVKFDY